jgi:FkbM family methyltransferase
MNKAKTVKVGRWLTRMRPLELALFLKWLLRIKRMEANVRGIKLSVDPASNFGQRVLIEGTYEASLTSAFERLLSRANNFVDVGANEGWFSMLAAKLIGPNGSVLACEPQERMWPAILKNTALNRFANVQLLPFALGRECARGFINLYPSVNTGSSHISGEKRRWEKTQPIEIVPLSTVLESRGLASVDLIKIDVEGFELRVLQGAGAFLGSVIRRVVIDIHHGPLRDLGESADEVWHLLESKGYCKRVVAGVDVWELA